MEERVVRRKRNEEEVEEEEDEAGVNDSASGAWVRQMARLAWNAADWTTRQREGNKKMGAEE